MSDIHEQSCREEIVYDSRKIHLVFSRVPVSTLSSQFIDTITNHLERKIVPCETWAELPEKLRLAPETICFNVDELGNSSVIDIVTMIHTMCRLVGIEQKISITVGIRRTTPYSLIKELQKSDVLGIVPINTEWGFDETLRGLRAQWAGIPYWPQHILQQLPGYVVKRNIGASVTLTPRQRQILRLIAETGASNKVIARKLKISESTVKLHVTGLLRKYNARNRTQLVLFSEGTVN